MTSSDPAFNFVLTEIGLGITLANRAITAYRLGFRQHGDSAKEKASEALQTAKRFIPRLDVEGQRIALAELRKLNEALKAVVDRHDEGGK